MPLLLPLRFKPRAAVLLLTVGLAGCAYPDYAQGVAPSYSDGYQPVMGGYASDWPAQPGAQWGPEDVPNIEVFQQPLSQYGRWLQSPQWGVVFVPNAQQGWRPYENGQWLDNRFWLSGDPWGWATDHYGRWGFDQQIGWVWVPDVTWGPSWVAWREADDVVGWAPIPPRVSWSVGIGFGSGRGYDNWNSWYAPSWVWVPRGNLYARGFGGRIYPWNTGNSWWGRSRWQNTPYWGWNQPWDRNWGWRAPNRGYGGNQNWGRQNWGGQNWNNNRNWNGNQHWNNNRDWNNGRDWNNNRDQRGYDPRRRQSDGGQPGSVGDRIGRDLNGQPPRQNGNGGWNGSNRPQGDVNRGWNRGNGVPGNYGNGSGQPPAGGWNGGNRQPRNADGGWQGRTSPQGGVSDRVADGMVPQQPRQNWQAQAQPQRQAQSQPQPQAQSQPQPQPQPRNNGGFQGRSNDGGNERRGDGGQPMRGGGQRSSGEGREQPQ